MEKNKKSYNTIDKYIARFPDGVQKKLKEMREVIQASAPDAEERISYQMPAFYLKGILVYFAAFKDHIGFFPTSSGIQAFEGECSGYKTSKGTLQLPLDKPLPLDLIGRMVKFRVAENLAKAAKNLSKEDVSGS